MAATTSRAHRLAQAAARKQAILADRAEQADMPSVIKRPLWERARQAFFKSQPLTHKQLLKHQMAEQGVE